MEKPSMKTRLVTRLAVLETEAEHLRNRIKAEAMTMAQAIESGASPQTIALAADIAQTGKEGEDTSRHSKEAYRRSIPT